MLNASSVCLRRSTISCWLHFFTRHSDKLQPVWSELHSQCLQMWQELYSAQPLRMTVGVADSVYRCSGGVAFWCCSGTVLSLNCAPFVVILWYITLYYFLVEIDIIIKRLCTNSLNKAIWRGKWFGMPKVSSRWEIGLICTWMSYSWVYYVITSDLFIYVQFMMYSWLLSLKIPHCFCELHSWRYVMTKEGRNPFPLFLFSLPNTHYSLQDTVRWVPFELRGSL